MHLPGLLFSWARLSTEDVDMAGGFFVALYMTSMVNMWSINHDPQIWESSNEFHPERFVEGEGK